MDGEPVISDVRDTENVKHINILLAPLCDSILGLSTLLEKQNELLAQINERQAAKDVSSQSIAPVPARSTSAWGALLRSALDNIVPSIDRWRGAIDTLLVFIALFSAVVTAFFVESSKNLEPDETQRTNELLTNLTDIFLAVNGVNFGSLNISSSEGDFRPDPRNVRVNTFWSLSLIMSVSLAALAVTCRGFLSALTASQYRNACSRLTEIFHRWERAEKLLGPLVESLPQLMLAPVLLFLAGLLDNLFSVIFQLTRPPVSLQVAVVISATFVAAVVANLFGFFVDGLLHPITSPFQSLLSRIFVSLVSQWSRFEGANSSDWTLDSTLPGSTNDKSFTRLNKFRKIFSLVSLDSVYDWIQREHSQLRVRGPHESLTSPELETYHKVLRLTHDDDLLDHAAASFQEILDKSALSSIQDSRHLPQLTMSEVQTLTFLLSAEASFRSNLTACRVISRWDRRYRSWTGDETNATLNLLSNSLILAAQRHASRSGRLVLWDSEFIATIARLYVRNLYRFWPWHNEWLSQIPPVIQMVWFAHYDGCDPQRLQQMSSFAFEAVYAKAWHQRQDVDSSIDTNSLIWWEAIIGVWLHPAKDVSLTKNNLEKNLRSMLASLAYAPITVNNPGRNAEPSDACIRAMLRWAFKQFPAEMIDACVSTTNFFLQHGYGLTGGSQWRQLSLIVAETNACVLDHQPEKLRTHSRIIDANTTLVRLIYGSQGWQDTPPSSRHPYRWETEPLAKILKLTSVYMKSGLSNERTNEMARSVKAYLDGIEPNDEDEQWRLGFLAPVVRLVCIIWPELSTPSWVKSPSKTDARSEELLYLHILYEES